MVEIIQDRVPAFYCRLVLLMKALGRWRPVMYLCSDRILTCRIKSIRSPAKVGLVVTDLITSPVVSWEGWETPPPQHRGSAVILCSTTGVVRPLCSCGDLLLSSARLCLRFGGC